MPIHTGGTHYISTAARASKTKMNDEKPFKCRLCPYAAKRWGHLKLHLRIHTGDKPFKCSFCPYLANQAGDLRIHMRTHTGEKPFKCPLCPYSATRAYSLKMHVRVHTKSFKCRRCPFSSDQESDLKLHSSTVHARQKSFKCTLCPYSADRSDHFKKHWRCHTGEKSFKCPQCPYSANRVRDVNLHMVGHTSRKPFRCPFCSFSAKRPGDLKMHTRIHAAEKPFNCSLCPYSTFRVRDFNKHAGIHAGQESTVQSSTAPVVSPSEVPYSGKQLDQLRTRFHFHVTENQLECRTKQLTRQVGTRVAKKRYGYAPCSFRKTGNVMLPSCAPFVVSEPLQCVFCLLLFHSLRSLTEHMRIHFGNMRPSFGSQYRTPQKVVNAYVLCPDDSITPARQAIPYVVTNTKSNPGRTMGCVFPDIGTTVRNNTLESAVTWRTSELLDELYSRPSIYRCACGVMFMDRILHDTHKACCCGEQRPFA